MSDFISEDGLVLILKYLPVKSLVRFRCVCKGWKRLIDSHSFVQEHLFVQKARFFVEYEGRKYLIVDPRPRPLVETLTKLSGQLISVVGTLHGVVCLYNFDQVMLWNPSIRKSSSILLPLDFKWYPFHEKYSCYGFWIDPSSKEFKIIMLRQEPVMHCILYSSIRRNWSVIPTEQLGIWKSCKEGPPVMVGGVAHWIGCFDQFIDRDHLEHDHLDRVILSFDFVQEYFGIIKTPPHSNRLAICRWQDMLSLVSWHYLDGRMYTIYSWKEDSWVEMLHFELDVDEYVFHVFWVMEDVEGRMKKGKRKREMEEWLKAIIGERQKYKVLATVVNDDSGELVLSGNVTGCKPVRKGLRNYDIVNIAYDFVESLLFP